MGISRNQSHFIIMTVIYNELIDHVLGKDKHTRNANVLISEIAETPFEDVDDFIKDSVTASLKSYGEAIDAFKPFLKGWTWDRIHLLTQSILIMSYAHYFKVEKINKKIVIDVAVDLTKKYVEDDQAKFVNAILDEVLI